MTKLPILLKYIWKLFFDFALDQRASKDFFVKNIMEGKRNRKGKKGGEYHYEMEDEGNM